MTDPTVPWSAGLHAGGTLRRAHGRFRTAGNDGYGRFFTEFANLLAIVRGVIPASCEPAALDARR
jgi:hypothetical protein